MSFTRNKCVCCESENDLQQHHISYDPEMTITLCVDCHVKVHNHGTGRPKGRSKNQFTDEEKKLAVLLAKGNSYKSVGNVMGCSKNTVSKWLKESEEDGYLTDKQVEFLKSHDFKYNEKSNIAGLPKKGEINDDIPIKLEK